MAFYDAFLSISEGSHVPDQEGSFWAMVVTFARSRIRDEARRHFAARRDIRIELGNDWLARSSSGRIEPSDPHPSPEEVAYASEMLEWLRPRLGRDEFSIFAMRLKGLSIAEIAKVSGCTGHTVRRRLQHIQSKVCSLVDGPECEPAASPVELCVPVSRHH